MKARRMLTSLRRIPRLSITSFIPFGSQECSMLLPSLKPQYSQSGFIFSPIYHAHVLNGWRLGNLPVALFPPHMKVCDFGLGGGLLTAIPQHVLNDGRLPQFPLRELNLRSKIGRASCRERG